VAALGQVADDVVALTQPAFFMAIGEFYGDFSQVTDEEVLAILASHPQPHPPPPAHSPPVASS
jgi:predicted phosphoribosyltransferase